MWHCPGDYKPEPNVNFQRERKTGIFSSCDLHLEFHHFFRTNFHLPSLFLLSKGEVYCGFLFHFSFSDKLLHLQLNSTVYLWSGLEEPFLLCPSQCQAASGSAPSNSELVPDWSLYFSASSHTVCTDSAVGSALWGCSSWVSLWPEAWSVQHSSFCVQPLASNHWHKYSPSWE